MNEELTKEERDALDAASDEDLGIAADELRRRQAAKKKWECSNPRCGRKFTDAEKQEFNVCPVCGGTTVTALLEGPE